MSHVQNKKNNKNEQAITNLSSVSVRISLLSIHTCKMAARRDLTLAEKVELIRKNEQNVPYRKLADEYKISIGSVSNIVKRKVEYIENYEQNENSNKKR